MIPLKEHRDVPFREDILRGVRLFAISLPVILLCVLAYRSLHKPLEAGSGQTPESSQMAPESSADAAPVAEAPLADAEKLEAHPLVVPPPPPVNGRSSGAPAPPRRHASRSADIPVPGPPPLHAKRAQAPVRREFESPAVLSSPEAPVAESPDATSAKSGIGYKSLIEANASRPLPAEPVAAAPPSSDSDAKANKGNRFLRALGKIFHRPKDEIVPLTIQQTKTPQP